MNIFKKMRILSAKTVSMVAKETGFAEQAIRSWESGRCTPKEDKLPVLANTYNCEVADFLEAYETER